MRRKLIGLAAALAVGGFAIFGLSNKGGDSGGVGFADFPGSNAGFEESARASAAWDTVRLVFINNPAVDHYLAGADAAILAANDTIDLDAAECSEFAYAVVDSAAPNSAFDTVMGSAYYYSWKMKSSAGSGTVPGWSWPSATRAALMFYLDWTKYIPANSTIIEAGLHSVNTAHYTTGRDSVVATLMTAPGDTLWHTSRGLDAAKDLPNLAHATWTYQISGLDALGYPAANGGPWVPDLNSRTRFWDYGSVSDQSGYAAALAGSTVEIEIPIKNCVQAAVNGTSQNGIFVTCTEASATTVANTMTHFEPQPNFSAYPAWIEVTYITKKYAAPFPGGKDWAFIFSTDDGRHVNEDHVDTFTAHGGRFSMYITEPFFGNTGAGGDTTDVFSDAEAITWANAGFEIGSHSVWHDADKGLNECR